MRDGEDTYNRNNRRRIVAPAVAETPAVAELAAAEFVPAVVDPSLHRSRRTRSHHLVIHLQSKTRE